MLSENTIQAVKAIPITEVISRHINIKKQGANYNACCPFHNESTPSFIISPAKDIYKCFGCGATGNAITFVMQHQHTDFITAIKTIAQAHNITIEEVNQTPQQQEQRQQKNNMAQTLQQVITQYQQNLQQLPPTDAVMQYLTSRNITADTIIEWQLGWATINWRHITPTLINTNQYQHAADMGIIKTGKADNTHYDGYRSRITIPIHNPHGQPIGIAGRYIQIGPADEGKEYPKYINPTQNPLYNKSNTLFAMHRATKAIHQAGFAWLTEGYFDTIAMHQYGDVNTIATCGTALTIQQAQQLKKHTSHIRLLRDADPAGQKATAADLKILLPLGFKVEVATLPPNYKDPDELIQSLTKTLKAA